MYIQKSDMKRLYIRSTESLIIWLSDLGGLIQILTITIGFAIGPLIRRQIMAALASENYQIQRYTRDQSEYYQSKNGKFATKLTSESDSETDKSPGDSNHDSSSSFSQTPANAPRDLL